MFRNNRVLILTVSMVVLAGVLSAGATLWHSLRLAGSYDDTVKEQLELRGLAYAQTSQAFIGALGPDGLGVIGELLTTFGVNQEPLASSDVVSPEFVGFQLWLPDAGEETGYSLVYAAGFGEAAGDGTEIDASTQRLVNQSSTLGEPGAAVDEAHEQIHLSVPVAIDSGTSGVLLATIDAQQEFAFFASQRRAAVRNGILLSGGIIAFVGLLGAGLSVYVSRDLTNRKRAEEALRASEERARQIIETASDAFVSVDADGRILAWNAQARVMFGWKREEALGLRLVDTVVPSAEREQYRTALRAIVEGRSPEALEQRFELRALHRDGHDFPVEVAIWARGYGAERGLNAFVHDISERKQMEDRLSHAATHDPLTGLLNRKRFEEEIDVLLSGDRKHDAEGAVLFLDLDQFKDVNDSLGHAMGDELLVRLASLFVDVLRDGDIIARLGGDEFGVLLPDAGQEQAVGVAEKVLQTLRAETFMLAQRPVSITGSIGVALFPQHGATSGDLLAHADLAMYRAKDAGRNRVQAYELERSWQEDTGTRVDWRNRIHNALERDRFSLYAQPILDLATNEVSQYELLLRMTAEDGRILLPAAFLGIAERSGSIQAIERWVVSRAIQLIAEHTSEAGQPRLEVNLSGKAFSDPMLLGLIQSKLAETGVDPANLVVEVTETAAIDNIAEAQEFLRSLRELGCRFALDDFGIGVSSFYLLKHLSVDYLKIDGSFIVDLPRSDVDRHMVRSMTELARGMGIKTVAEYVADEETVELVRGYGVDYVQGYHIGRAEPAERILAARAPQAKVA